MSSEAWIKLAVRTIRDPKIVTLSSDAARWAFIAILVAAKEQSPQGHFASEDHLRGVVPPTVAEHLVELVESGLLVVDPEGGISPSRWRRYQVDPTAADRQAAARERKSSVTHRDSTVTKIVTHRDGHGHEREMEKEIEKETKYSLKRAPKNIESIAEILGRAERIDQ